MKLHALASVTAALLGAAHGVFSEESSAAVAKPVVNFEAVVDLMSDDVGDEFDEEESGDEEKAYSSGKSGKRKERSGSRKVSSSSKSKKRASGKSEKDRKKSNKDKKASSDKSEKVPAEEGGDKKKRKNWMQRCMEKRPRRWCRKRRDEIRRERNKNKSTEPTEVPSATEPTKDRKYGTSKSRGSNGSGESSKSSKGPNRAFTSKSVKTSGDGPDLEDGEGSSEGICGTAMLDEDKPLCEAVESDFCGEGRSHGRTMREFCRYVGLGAFGNSDDAEAIPPKVARMYDMIVDDVEDLLLDEYDADHFDDAEDADASVIKVMAMH